MREQALQGPAGGGSYRGSMGKGFVLSAQRRLFRRGRSTGGNRRRLLAGGAAGRVSGAVALNGKYILRDTKTHRRETSHGRGTGTITHAPASASSATKVG
jgi:hypothetical protein